MKRIQWSKIERNLKDFLMDFVAETNKESRQAGDADRYVEAFIKFLKDEVKEGK